MNGAPIDPASIVGSGAPVLALKTAPHSTPGWHDGGYARADLLADDHGALAMRAVGSLDEARKAALAMSRHRSDRPYLETDSVVVHRPGDFAVVPVYWQSKAPGAITEEQAEQLLVTPNVVGVASRGSYHQIEGRQERALLPGARLGWVGSWDSDLRVDDPVGRQRGYATLSTATRAATRLSVDERPGIAVMRRDPDHYDLATVETVAEAPDGGWYFDPLALDGRRASELERGLHGRAAALTRIVDDDVVVSLAPTETGVSRQRGQ